jgi:hypothetical protein
VNNPLAALTIMFGIVSFILGVMNLIQFITSIASGSSLRVRAQADYNNWYRVAQIADMISKEPSKAAELIRNVNGIADAARNEIKAYSREKLNFVPSLDPAYDGGPHPPKEPSLWEKTKSAFTPK